MSAEDRSDESERLRRLRAAVIESKTLVERRLVRATATHQRFMTARLITFGLFAGLFLWVAAARNEFLADYTLLPALLLFVGVVVAHQKTIRERARLGRLVRLLESKRARIDGEFGVRDERRTPSAALIRTLTAKDAVSRNELDPGTVEDLALIGAKNSLANVLDAVHSRLGRALLDDDLRRPHAEAHEIIRRQETTRELAERVKLRHDLEQVFASIDASPASASDEFLSGKGEAATIDDGVRFRVADRVLVVASYGAWALALGTSTSIYSLVAAVVAVVVNVRLRRLGGAIVALRNELIQLEPVLRAIGEVGRHFEREPARAEHLRDLASRIAHLSTSERRPLPRLLVLLAWLKIYRLGLVYVAFNWLTFYDLWFGAPLLRFWRDERAAFDAAIASLARLEVHIAYADVAEEQSHWNYPTVLAGDTAHLEIRRGRHPLLSSCDAVANDITLDGKQPTAIVTGSNMSGKSTFMKSCGQNVVLACLGAPVRAATMSLTPPRLGTVINVHDELASGESFFAVEVRRVGSLLSAAADRRPIVVILDELFRGTNSREKVAAGQAVIRQFTELGALTLVATHDHEMTRLEAELPGRVENFHFSDSVVGDKMTFDYLLRRGPAPGCNAIRVLETRGFPAAVVADAKRRAGIED